jgi:PhnB protein
MNDDNKAQFAPQLYIPGAVTDISFYATAFGAVELRRFNNDNGTVHVAELSIDAALFHIHEDKVLAGNSVQRK